MEKQEVTNKTKESKWKKRLFWAAGITAGVGLCALAAVAGYRHHDKKVYFHGVTLTFDSPEKRYKFEEIMNEINKDPDAFIDHIEEMTEEEEKFRRKILQTLDNEKAVSHFKKLWAESITKPSDKIVDLGSLVENEKLQLKKEEKDFESVASLLSDYNDTMKNIVH